MVDKMSRQTSKRATSSPRRDPSLYASAKVTLPTFALAVLRRRAKRLDRSLSRVLESAVWETVWMDEVQAMIDESPEMGRAFREWFAYAVKRPKK